MLIGLFQGLVARIRRRPRAPLNLVVTVKDRTDLDECFLKEIETYASGYALRVFDDTECRAFLEQHYGEEFAQKFNRIKRGRHKADLFRYAYLYLHGGVYVGVNTRLIRDLDGIIEDRSACYMIERVKGSYLHNGFVYTPPKNPLVHMILMDVLIEKSIEHLSSDVYILDFKSFNVATICSDKALRTGRNRTKIGPDLVLYYSFEDTELTNKSNRYSAIYTDQNVKIFEERNVLNISDYENSLRRNTESNCLPKYFSEYGEDEWVIKHADFKRDGYFIDIGTENGRDNSKTYLLDVRFGWKGICIASKMSNMSDRSAKQYQGIITNRYVYRKQSFDKMKDAQTVPTTFVDILFQEFGVPKRIDFLCINMLDAIHILSGIDFSEYFFEIISIRHNNIETYRYEIHGFLKHRGYAFKMKFCDSDLFLYKPKHLSFWK